MEIKDTESGYKAVIEHDGETLEYKHGADSEQRAKLLAENFGPSSRPGNWIQSGGEQYGENGPCNPHKRPEADVNPDGCPSCGGPTSVSGQKCDGCR